MNYINYNFYFIQKSEQRKYFPLFSHIEKFATSCSSNIMLDTIVHEFQDLGRFRHATMLN